MIQKLKKIIRELNATKLQIRCTGEIGVDYHELKELQSVEDGRSLKQTDDSHIFKLAESLLRFGLVNNLQIWIDPEGNQYCFDAHHRQKALEVLEFLKIEIPLLPATRCLAENKKEAKQLLLIKESKNSWIDVEVVEDYILEIGCDFELISNTVELPEVDWTLFSDDRKNSDNSEVSSDQLNGDVKSSTDDFMILIKLDNVNDQESLFNRLTREGYECRVLTS